MSGLIKEDYIKFYSDPSEFPTSGASASYSDGTLNIRDGGSSITLGRNNQSNLSVEMTRMPGGMITASAGTAANTTWQTFAETIGDFEWVRVGYESIQATSIVITSAGIGVCSTLSQWPNVDGDIITPLTFSGIAKGTIPPLVSTNNPGILVSDWVRVKSVPRTDSGKYPLIAIRTYFNTPDGSGAGKGYSYRSKTGISGPYSNNPSNFTWKCGVNTGDGVAVPTTFTNTGTTDNFIPSFIQILSSKHGATVAFCGDSVMAGTATIGNTSSAGILACQNISTPTFPVVPLTLAYGGSSPDAYLPRTKAFFGTTPISVAFYQASSVNEAISTQAIADKHFAYVIDFIRSCNTYKIIPVIETCPPQNRGSDSADAFRQAFNQRILSLQSNGSSLIVIDTATLITDPLNKYRFLPKYNSGDNLHLNDLGHQAMTPLKEQAIRLALGL